MGVYLYSNTYEYSYTFKWKTLAEITSEWTSTVWGVATNSDGATWTWQNNDLNIVTPIPSLATAKTVIISWTVVANDSTKNAWALYIGAESWWGTGRAGYQVYGSYFTWLTCAYGDGTNHLWNKVGDGVWGNTYKPTVTIDLENKLITGVLSWFSNSTLTLTDARVNHIRQFEYLRVYAAANWSTISDVSIRIEA